MIVKDEYYRRASAVMSERRLTCKSGGYTVADAAYIMQHFDEVRHMVMTNAAAAGIDLNKIIIVKR